MPSIDISLSLSVEQCREYYAGEAQVVHARSMDGRRVQFPARALHRVVGPQGVHGIYRLTFNPSGRFESLIRVAG
ncbi:DUF2835 family protein [Larsenimonas rhizosphaerae]|uniref:DUF2835 family protein n=1 Tax=Larsenimonas rhizosphaerae TaxID=2944682 RepID=A0AA42CU96_9GAMM|nr:DUF2835 family protein [Larsenimonas rhizosphaerae]MCM2129789.1 DUF2835 domain-containing protein [Larsenimonas rhizosphaerae]MCX2524452.1 DUF2835 family protein [Larsenimonas rhizosphaerae]